MNSISLITPLGTQIVSRIAIKTPQGELLCPVGAVGVIVKTPTDNTHSYRVQFTNAVRLNDLLIRLRLG
jgi:hypothetical protein